MKTIAETTTGSYFRAEDKEGLQAIYDKINELETTEIKSMSYLEYNEEFGILVLLALILLLGEILLLSTKLRKIP